MTPISDLEPAERSSQADALAIELHREALDLYRKRDFSAAGARFMEVNATFQDPASRKLAERCKEYLSKPPPAEWNGSYAMLDK